MKIQQFQREFNKKRLLPDKSDIDYILSLLRFLVSQVL